MNKLLAFTICLLLCKHCAQAQEAAISTKGATDYLRITVTIFVQDEQGMQVKHVFAATGNTEAAYSAAYHQCAEYMAQLRTKGYSLQGEAKGDGFVEYTYCKQKRHSKP